MSINDLNANKRINDINKGNENGVNIEYLNLIVTIPHEINNKINRDMHNRISCWFCNIPRANRIMGIVYPKTNYINIKKITTNIEIL